MTRTTVTDPTTPAGAGLDPAERLLWTALRRVESLALESYQRYVPALASPAKKEVVALLDAQVPTDEALNASALGGPIDVLCRASETGSEGATLCVQGIVLEALGRVIYARLADSPAAGPLSRRLADIGGRAADEASRSAIVALERRLPTADERQNAFFRATGPVLACFDEVGSAVDRALGERFGLRFADLLADVTTDIIEACVGLGLSRRKLVCHFTAAFMGA